MLLDVSDDEKSVLVELVILLTTTRVWRLIIRAFDVTHAVTLLKKLDPERFAQVRKYVEEYLQITLGRVLIRIDAVGPACHTARSPEYYGGGFR